MRHLPVEQLRVAGKQVTVAKQRLTGETRASVFLFQLQGRFGVWLFYVFQPAGGTKDRTIFLSPIYFLARVDSGLQVYIKVKIFCCKLWSCVITRAPICFLDCRQTHRQQMKEFVSLFFKSFFPPINGLFFGWDVLAKLWMQSLYGFYKLQCLTQTICKRIKKLFFRP